MFSHPEKNVEQWNLPLGSVVADLGSGSGHYVLALAKAVGDKGRVYAVDVQKDLLTKLKNEAVRQNLKNVEVIWGDIEKVGGTKIKDGLLDVVLLSNILFQVKEKETLVKEASRILKSAGIVFVIDWQDSFGGLGPQNDMLVSRDSVVTLFQGQGFVFDKDFSSGEHHYGLIFKKP